MKNKSFTIATRDSVLAVTQADTVRKLLSERGIPSELLKVKTKGDEDRISPLDAIGGDGLFVRGIEKALLDGRADIAVHSGKDLPYELMDGLTIAAVPKAADGRDVLLLSKGAWEKPDKIIGTSSNRRKEQYALLDSKAVFKNIRGNITTRLEKLESGEYDGIILAKAALDRIGKSIDDYRGKVFEPSEMVPAACQGLLAVECRSDDEGVISALAGITDETAYARFEAERYLFRLIGADCSMGVGVHAYIIDDECEYHVYYKGNKYYERGKMTDYKDISMRLYERIKG